jgi:general stress protein 26
MSTALAAAQALTDDSAKIDKLKSLIENIRFCMMTTIGEDGALHSRPMSFLEWSDNGALLFFTSATSATLRQIKNQRMVDLAFCEPSQNVYVSLLGEAKVLNDRALTEKLFSPIMRNWFPGGPQDPALRLLSVTPMTAEYWDGLSGLSLLLSLAKARLTDTPQKTGEHEYFEL